jgi:hypothetical protein
LDELKQISVLNQSVGLARSAEGEDLGTEKVIINVYTIF